MLKACASADVNISDLIGQIDPNGTTVDDILMGDLELTPAETVNPMADTIQNISRQQNL